VAGLNLAAGLDLPRSSRPCTAMPAIADAAVCWVLRRVLRPQATDRRGRSASQGDGEDDERPDAQDAHARADDAHELPALAGWVGEDRHGQPRLRLWFTHEAEFRADLNAM
jgi:hypothetical protein